MRGDKEFGDVVWAGVRREWGFGEVVKATEPKGIGVGCGCLRPTHIFSNFLKTFHFGVTSYNSPSLMSLL